MRVYVGNPVQMDFPIYGTDGTYKDNLAAATRLAYMIKKESDDTDSEALVSKEIFPHVVGEVLFQGDGSPVPPGILQRHPLTAGSLSVTDGVETFTDDGVGVLTGDQGGSGTLDYITGAYILVFSTNPTSDVVATYDTIPSIAVLLDTPKVGRVRVVLSTLDTANKTGQYVHALQVEWGTDKIEKTLGDGRFTLVQDIIR